MIITEKGTGERGRWRYDKKTKRLEAVGKPRLSIVDAPFVHPDTIPPTESMATDKREVFESKSALMRHYAEHGYECVGKVDVRGPKEYKPDQQQIADDWREAERLAKWGMVPLTEREKQLCIEEERNYQEWKKRQSTRVQKKA